MTASHMKVIGTTSEMQQWRRNITESVAFVPTMGALHEGHLSLIRLANQYAQKVVISIFVNPLQFEKNEDFSRYPRTFEEDLKRLEPFNVDVVFTPASAQMYSNDFLTVVNVKKISEKLCGQYRPGHFEGVATVVLKLFHIVKPHVAIFGNKDFQQRVLIEKMVKDLNLDVTIVGAPIVRESDRLAMSSRNRYLSLDERERASILYRALVAAKEKFLQGERSPHRLIKIVSEMVDTASPTKVDYIAVCDMRSLEEVDIVDKKAVLLVAVWFGKTRLIDNIILENGQN